MSTIKNGQISLYCYFKEIMKGPGTSFQYPALSQKHVRNVCHAPHQYLTEFHFDSTQDSKEISTSVTSILQQCLSDAYDDVTDFEICGFHKSTKIQISRERNIFSSNKKNHLLHIKGYFMARNSFVAEVAFKL